MKDQAIRFHVTKSGYVGIIYKAENGDLIFTLGNASSERLARENRKRIC